MNVPLVDRSVSQKCVLGLNVIIIMYPLNTSLQTVLKSTELNKIICFREINYYYYYVFELKGNLTDYTV